jgi:hypothetical protein
VGARERTKRATESLWCAFIGRGGGKRGIGREGLAINAMGAPVLKAFKGRGLDGGEMVGD